MCFGARAICLYVGAIVTEATSRPVHREGIHDVSDLGRPVGEYRQFVVEDGECGEVGSVVLCFLCAFTCYQNRIYIIRQSR